jgi:hypothetical protein
MDSITTRGDVRRSAEMASERRREKRGTEKSIINLYERKTESERERGSM